MTSSSSSSAANNANLRLSLIDSSDGASSVATPLSNNTTNYYGSATIDNVNITIVDSTSSNSSNNAIAIASLPDWCTHEPDLLDHSIAAPPPDVDLSCSSLCCRFSRAIAMLPVYIIAIPLVIVAFVLLIIIAWMFLLFWCATGFGYCYESYAERRDRRLYAPPSGELRAYGPSGEMIHVVSVRLDDPSADLSSPSPQPTLPPILFVSGLGASMSLVAPMIATLAANLRSNYSGPIDITSWDSPGYGYSDPLKPSDGADDSVDTVECEMQVMQRVIDGFSLTARGPFIVFGASAGCTMAQLYRLHHPNSIRSIVLYDPTPNSVYTDASNPMYSDFTKAPSIYSTMAGMTRFGLLRPMGPLMTLIPGEFGDIFRVLPKSHLSIFMTGRVLRKTGRHFTYWQDMMREVCEGESKYANDDGVAPESRASYLAHPLLVVSAQFWSRPHGKLSLLAMRDWWATAQNTYVRSSSNGAMINRTDRYHTTLMMDMTVAAAAIRTVEAKSRE